MVCSAYRGTVIAWHTNRNAFKSCSGTTREVSGGPTLPSISRPTQAQQEDLQAAIAEVPASATSLLAATAEAAASQTPSETLQKRLKSAGGAVLATSTGAVTDTKVTAAPIAAAEEVNTQLEALPILEAKATGVATSSGSRSFYL